MSTRRLLSVVCLALMVGAPAQVVSGQQVPGRYADHFFGAVHLGDGDMAFADSVGARWSRHGVRWHQHQPRPDSAYDFTASERLMTAARDHDVRLMPVLGNVPTWASTKDDTSAVNPHHYPPTEAAVDDWQAYVEAIVERYPEVEYFEVWNEPNIDWFLNADTNYTAYIDRVLIPAAQVIHAHDRKVVAPSFTLEWPMDSWPADARPDPDQRNAQAAIEDLDRWLSYRDAWTYIDVLSVHYGKGDVTPSVPTMTSMMPVYDHIFDHWIRTGKLEGIWNTEAGLTASEAGTGGFVALEPWERAPYAQWVPRYTIPVFHWALRHDWDSPQQYKLFWYHLAQKSPEAQGMLRRTNLVTPGREEHRVSRTGDALNTVSTLLTSADSVGTFDGTATVGFGLDDNTNAANHFAPLSFTTYPFRLDDRVLVAAWLDRPGLTFESAQQGGIEVRVEGLRAEQTYRVETVDYVTGERTTVATAVDAPGGTLRLDVPRTEAPILYLHVVPTG